MKAAIILHWNCLLPFLSALPTPVPRQLECGLLQGRNQMLFISGSLAPNSGLCPEQVLNKYSLCRWINDCAGKRYQDARIIQMRARLYAIEGNWGRLPKAEWVWDGNKMALPAPVSEGCVFYRHRWGRKTELSVVENNRHKGRRGGQVRNSEGWGRRVPVDI